MGKASSTWCGTEFQRCRTQAHRRDCASMACHGGETCGGGGSAVGARARAGGLTSAELHAAPGVEHLGVVGLAAGGALEERAGALRVANARLRNRPGLEQRRGNKGEGWRVSIPLGTDENMARFGLVLICGADQAAVPAWRRWHEAHLQRLDVVGVDVQQVGKDGPHRADVARMHLQLGPLLQAAPRQAPGRLSAHGWATTCHTPLSIRVGTHRPKG